MVELDKFPVNAFSRLPGSDSAVGFLSATSLISSNSLEM